MPSIHVPILAPGQTARVEIENNRELSGTVRLAPAAVDARTQLGHARVSMERDPKLRLGMFARATIEANRSRGISVPRSAVFYRTEGPSVQIVRDDIIETRRVRVGLPLRYRYRNSRGTQRRRTWSWPMRAARCAMATR